MGVNGKAGDIESIAENNVGAFPADSGQPGQFLHALGNFPAEIISQGLSGADNIFLLYCEKVRLYE